MTLTEQQLAECREAFGKDYPHLLPRQIDDMWQARDGERYQSGYAAALARGQGEAVAWATRLGEYAHIEWGAKPDDPIHNIPLFTNAPPSPQPTKQPWPNHNWCVGCSPDNCSGCGTEPNERRSSQPCPHIVTSKEGTSELAEKVGAISDSPCRKALQALVNAIEATTTIHKYSTLWDDARRALIIEELKGKQT